MFSMVFLIGVVLLVVLVVIVIGGLITLSSRKSGHGRVPCPGCGQKIPQFTESCPHCGRQLLPPADP